MRYQRGLNRAEREPVLEDIEAFDLNTAESLFKRDVICFSRKSDDLTIEIPDRKHL